MEEKWGIHIKHLSDVPASRNWYKLCRIFTKIHIYTILYKSSRLKQIVLPENDDIPQEPENFWLEFFYFVFLIDIIDNIITYSPYSPYYVTRTSTNDSPVSLSCDTDGNHVASILHCHWLKLRWRNTDYTDTVIILSINNYIY